MKRSMPSSASSSRQIWWRARGEHRIFGSLATGDAGYARVAMGRAELVGRRIAVDPQHPGATPGQLIGGGGAHRAQAKDNDIVRDRHVLYIFPQTPARCRAPHLRIESSMIGTKLRPIGVRR